MTQLDRRKFLKYLAVTGAVGASSLYSYRWLQGKSQEASGENTLPTPPSDAMGPLLLVTNSRSENPFGPYLAEILRAEGLNLFQTADLQMLDEPTLQQFALVLLAEGPVDKVQLVLLEAYVAEGGHLIAMRPESHLASLFGVESAVGTTVEAYLKIDDQQSIGQNLTPDAIQFHGQANHYRPDGAGVVAWLYSESSTPADLPAVTLHQYGQGQAALWAFDLARSIAYTRQGNPAWVDQERDGADGVRAHDAFVDWIDLDRVAIPQADEQMRLLSQLIDEMLGEELPLPRLWYFPDASPAMLVVTGDAHANPTANIEALLSQVEAYKGTMSVYYTPPDRSSNMLRRQASLILQRVQNSLDPFPDDDPEHLPTPSEVAGWRARGHEFSLHPYVEEGVDRGYQTYVAAFEAEGYGKPGSTVRTHRILWDGWADTAKAQADHGFGMSVDFYHIGPSFQTKAGRWVQGYFTGSGLPMKMVDETGQVIEVYQLLTELVDEYLLQDVNAGWRGLDSQAAIAISQQMIDEAVQYHTALTTQFHVDFYYPDSPVRAEVEAWAKGTMAYAAQKGLPIWSAARFLEFTRCRDQTRLFDVMWDKDERHLTFKLLTGICDGFDVTVQLPNIRGGYHVSRVEVDGQPATFTVPDKGITGQAADQNSVPYTLVSIPPGQHGIAVWYSD